MNGNREAARYIPRAAIDISQGLFSFDYALAKISYAGLTASASGGSAPPKRTPERRVHVQSKARVMSTLRSNALLGVSWN